MSGILKIKESETYNSPANLFGQYQLTTDHKLHHRRKNTDPPAPVVGAKEKVKGRNVSARKLAAGLWHLAATSAGSSGGVKRQCGLTHHPLLSWVPIKSVMEEATSWDLGRLKMAREDHSNSILKIYGRRLTATTSVAPALQLELIRARNCIRELEADKGHHRKKFKHVVRKLDEEKRSWMRRERQKTHYVIDGLKDDFRKERQYCKRLDVANSKLLVDIADSKSLNRQYMHDYEKERKSRELLEEACDKLVKEIEEEKTEIEALKRKSARVGEEVEEERKRLQLAEVWREEQVQMKLIDAKLIFEEKYCLMSTLISELESFLRFNNVIVDMTNLSEVQEAKQQAVDSLKMQDLKEFCSTSPISNDIYTTTSNITNRCIGDSTRSHSSADQFVGNESKRCATQTSSECSNRFLDPNKSCKDADAIDRAIYLSSDNVNHEQNTGQLSSLELETKEISSVPKQTKKKGSSFRKLWTTSLDKSRRHSNGSTDNVDIIFSGNVAAERAVASRDFANHCCSGDPRNQHITRAMKGCIEWPRVIQKNGLKSKILDARLESQKSQSIDILEHRN